MWMVPEWQRQQQQLRIAWSCSSSKCWCWRCTGRCWRLGWINDKANAFLPNNQKKQPLTTSESTKNIHPGKDGVSGKECDVKESDVRVPGVVGERKVEGGSALYVAVMNLVYMYICHHFSLKGRVCRIWNWFKVGRHAPCADRRTNVPPRHCSQMAMLVAHCTASYPSLHQHDSIFKIIENTPTINNHTLWSRLTNKHACRAIQYIYWRAHADEQIWLCKLITLVAS